MPHCSKHKKLIHSSLSLQNDYFTAHPCQALHSHAWIFALLLSGCVAPEIAPPPEKPLIPTVNPEVVNLKNKINLLEQTIAEKEKLIKEQQQITQKNQLQTLQTLQKANKEAAHTQLKLQRLATKPGTASALAEAEVALGALDSHKIPANNQILRIQAHHLLETASKQYEKNQFTMAMNYVTQAKHFISLLTEPESKRVGAAITTYLEFHTPIQLAVRSAAYFRNAPANHAKILATLKKGTPVTALACQGSWLYVHIDSMEGWIHNTMLDPIKNIP